jgi:hypothetical protein
VRRPWAPTPLQPLPFGILFLMSVAIASFGSLLACTKPQA